MFNSSLMFELNKPIKKLCPIDEKKVNNLCQTRELNMKRSLAQRGLTETITWSFMSNKNAQIFGMNNNLEIQNPISSDLDIMRQSILPNLLDAACYNIDNGEEKVCIFELGPIFNSEFDSESMSLMPFSSFSFNAIE